MPSLFYSVAFATTDILKSKLF